MQPQESIGIYSYNEYRSLFLIVVQTQKHTHRDLVDDTDHLSFMYAGFEEWVRAKRKVETGTNIDDWSWEEHKLKQRLRPWCMLPVHSGVDSAQRLYSSCFYVTKGRSNIITLFDLFKLQVFRMIVTDIQGNDGPKLTFASAKVPLSAYANFFKAV